MAVEEHNTPLSVGSQPALNPSRSPASFLLWQRVLVFGVVFFVCAEAGNYLSAPNRTFVTFWLPAGLSVGVLLLNRTRDWPRFLLAILPANFAFDYFHGTGFWLTLYFYLANVVQAVTGAWLVRRFVAERPTMATLKEFVGLVGFAAVLSTMPVSALGAVVLGHAGLSHSFVQSWTMWWGSTGMAVLVLTSFILAWAPKPDERLGFSGSRKKMFEAGILFVGLGAVLWYLLAWDKGVMAPNKALLIPLLLWAGLRFGQRGATAASLLLALTLAFFTTQFSCGLTPAQVASGEYVFTLQTTLAMALLISLVPAVVLSERDRTLAELRESEERFRNLTEAAYEGICISEKGRILDVNDQFVALFGYPRSELIGREILTLIAPEWRERIAERLRRSEEAVVEHRLLRQDGTVFDGEAQSKTVPWRGRRVRVTAVRDISERKQAECALRASEEKFSKAFRASPDGLAISEVETGRYLEVNDGYCRLYGYRREEMLDHTSLELRVWEDPEDRARFVVKLKTDGQVRDVEVRTRTRSGELKIIQLSAEPVEVAGKSCFLSVLHDITDRKRAEAETEAAIQREQQARLEFTLQLIASQEAERRRIAAELHDSLGQNLILIKNLAQMVLRGEKPDETHEQVASINHLAAQCIGEARRISHDLHPYQLEHLGLTQALAALVVGASTASGTAFKRKLDAVDDVFSREAATNLYRIVQEGMNNILKYARAKNARVTLERDLHEVVLSIEDDGCGFKLGASNGSKGMGLKNIAERTRILGGQLKLDSAPGQGTRLEITIPISAGPE